MESLIAAVGQWLPFALFIGVLLLMLILLLRGAKATCCKTGQDWYDRPPIDFQALRGTSSKTPIHTRSSSAEAKEDRS